MKIYKKLSISFLGIILIIGVSGHFFVKASQDELQHVLVTKSLTQAQATIDRIDRIAYRRIRDFQLYAISETVQEEVVKSNREFEMLQNIERHISRVDKEWVSAGKDKITPFMQKLMTNKLSENLKAIDNFYKKRYEHPIFREIFLTNRYGANIAQIGKTVDYRQDKKEWWQATKKDGLNIGDVNYDKDTDAYYASIGVRIDDKDGEFTGILKALLDIGDIINIVEAAPEVVDKGKEGQEIVDFKVVNNNGEIIHSTRNFTVMEGLRGELLDAFKKFKKDPIANPCFWGKGGELFIFAASGGYKGYQGLGWTLIQKYETEKILAPVARFRKFILLIVSAGLLLSVLLGIYIIYSISRPIITLTKAMNEVGRGNLDVEVEYNKNDEIGRLSLLFNNMVYDLKELKAQNKKKRVELETSQDILKDKVDELESFAKLTVDRELKMIDLKKRIEVLEREADNYKGENNSGQS